MSVKPRILWIVPAAVLASWLAVRSLAAYPADGLEDPPISTVMPKIADPVLAEMISRFAVEARLHQN